MNPTSLHQATESARAALASLATDVLGIADVLAHAFGLPFPSSPEATSTTLPGATERICQSLDAVTATCSSAADQLRAATRPGRPTHVVPALERIDDAATTFGDDVAEIARQEAEFDPDRWASADEIAAQVAATDRKYGDDPLRKAAEQITGGPVEQVEAEITGDGVRYIDDDGDPDEWPTPEEGDKIMAEGYQADVEIEALEDEFDIELTARERAVILGETPPQDDDEDDAGSASQPNRKARRRKAAKGRRKK